MSLSLPAHGEKGYSPVTDFLHTIIYKNFSLRKYLISKGIISIMQCSVKNG
jgi:hypothetical protein